VGQCDRQLRKAYCPCTAPTRVRVLVGPAHEDPLAPASLRSPFVACVLLQAEGPPGSSGWPAYSLDQDAYLALDLFPNTEVVTGVRRAQCDVWDTVPSDGYANRAI
jgi:hypothetical protein